MVVTSPKQRNLFEKLLVLAKGDMHLVEAAIRQNTEAPGEPADLQKVIAYIRDKRDASDSKKVA
ncbi:hypothetical protein ACI7BZ_05565 [Xanthobacter sp. AM11]|uniref:hypothetical protein n=1 Tax=Xanthobacter sp. AM11 TaxID=3380643 RepID=UPI0039BEDB64